VRGRLAGGHGRRAAQHGHDAARARPVGAGVGAGLSGGRRRRRPDAAPADARRQGWEILSTLACGNGGIVDVVSWCCEFLFMCFLWICDCKSYLCCEWDEIKWVRYRWILWIFL
jgi:hypothetical protein